MKFKNITELFIFNKYFERYIGMLVKKKNENRIGMGRADKHHQQNFIKECAWGKTGHWFSERLRNVAR